MRKHSEYLILLLGSILFLKLEQLETDSQILLEKASSALKKYNMHAVVANELATRKEEVTVVTIHGNACIRREAGDDIENPLIQLLAEKHRVHIEANMQSHQ